MCVCARARVCVPVWAAQTAMGFVSTSQHIQPRPAPCLLLNTHRTMCFHALPRDIAHIGSRQQLDGQL